MSALSTITAPSCPVCLKPLDLLITAVASTCSVAPPMLVQASPVTTPGVLANISSAVKTGLPR